MVITVTQLTHTIMSADLETPVIAQNGTVKHVRFDRLKQVCDKALKESQKILTDDNLYSCYPSLANSAEGQKLITGVKDQLIQSWESNITAELDAIFKERDVESKLNELDQLIHEAQKKKQNPSNSEPLIPINQLTPSNILSSHLLPIKQANLEKLRNQLKDLQDGNLELLNELQEQVSESQQLKQEISTEISKINSVNELVQDDSLETKLKELIELTRKEEST